MAAAQTAIVRQARVPRRIPPRVVRRTVAFYVMVSPWLISFVALTIIPVVLGVLTSFTDYDGLNLDTLRWMGTKNYAAPLQTHR